jgi:GTP-binding protein
VSAYAYEKGRAVILVISKWDMTKGEIKLNAYIEKVRQSLKHLNYAPIVFTSAKSGFGLDRLFPMIHKVYQQHSQRIGTSELNRFVEAIMDHHPPPTKGGKRGRIFYITQIGVRPPRFLVSVNDPKLIHFSYRRYLTNELRKRYDFTGVPLLVGYRGRTVDPKRKKYRRK